MKIIYIYKIIFLYHTSVSFSPFLALLNLKSLNEGLFFKEPGVDALAGHGIGLRGEVEGNLGEKKRED